MKKSKLALLIVSVSLPILAVEYGPSENVECTEYVQDCSIISGVQEGSCKKRNGTKKNCTGMNYTVCTKAACSASGVWTYGKCEGSECKY